MGKKKGDGDIWKQAGIEGAARQSESLEHFFWVMEKEDPKWHFVEC